jgi:hypothetical protein
MYLIQLGPKVYERRGGGGFTLVEALTELRGTGGARILRLDGSVAVERAGSDFAVEHSSGRTVIRRKVRRR